MISAELIATVLGGKGILHQNIHSLTELNQAVQRGLPKQCLRQVVSQITTDRKALSELMYQIVPQASYNRRTQALSFTESERTERLARVVATAWYVWDDQVAARQFLNQTHPALEGQTPIEATMSELGARQVEQILWSLFYGVPA